MNTPYYSSPTSWWSRSKPSSKLTKERPLEGATLPRTYSPLQADGLITNQPAKQSSMFGNFTSAIRFKPKKSVHTIAIQEPPKVPSPLIIPPSNSVEPYGPLTSRPYSKAVSAVTITDEDSIGPKTPLDLRLSYQKSLMDADPFAATTRVVFSSPKESQDLEQLFVLPDAHVTKDPPVSPQIPYRRPRTPHLIRERLMSESTTPSPRPPANKSAVTVQTSPDVLNKRLNPRTRKVSMNDISAPSSVNPSPVTASTPASYGRSKSKGSDGPRPHTRPRGMTDNSGIRPSLRKDVDLPSLTRKPSFSRSIITLPETSPPTQALPPIPSLKHLPALPTPDRSPTDLGSSSSSSLSFASSTSEYEPTTRDFCAEDRRQQSVRDKAAVLPEPRTKSPTRIFRGALSPALSRRPLTADDRLNSLKKMPSQPTLQNKFTGSPSGYLDDHSSGVDDTSGSPKPLRKQRSFHHPRVPLPPLPYLRHATSFTPSEVPVSQSVDLSTEKEKERPREKEKEKRESTASLPKRRFLPGPIRRGSAFTFDDDTGSLIIPPSEFDRFDKSPPPRFSNPFGSPGVESMMLPATSTFYDDLAGSPPAASHFPQPGEAQPSESGPQQILSAAQLLKLEELLENDERVASPDSNRTSPADLGSPEDSIPPVPPPFEEFGFGHGVPRKNSWTDSIVSTSTIFSNALSDKVVFADKVETGSTLSFFDQQQRPGYRPRTASGNFAVESTFPVKRSYSPLSSSSQSTISMGIESTFGIEPNQPLGGLTPPPRLRARVTVSPKIVRGSGNRDSIVPIQPLSPPPLRRIPTSASVSSRSTSSRSSSSLKEVGLPPPAFKNDPPRRGIMKKPSFLEIDDDPEADAMRVQVLIGGDIHQRNISISSVDDSFLDLGRGNNSFDTIRTLSVEGPG